ncbi:thioredoxin family protein [Pedobacter duraquae]|uniref:Peroxiredoxin n=1 Tax=Pedobacter duraquae TaxID=425511 RepID=A0A4R6IL30_9SPHI|nr:thioredoxin family protein [Pedobacter duraquae]TDO22819.1 peroxiredoxin [Pedobacter duraquae]
MKNYIIILLAMLSVSVGAQVKTLTPGMIAPEISLKNVDGKTVGFSNFPKAKGFIVVFTCNTCPYAKGYEQRIIELNAKYASQGYPVIAINPNDPIVSAGDSFEKMQELAKAKKYSFPYLFDAGQKVTDLYGATKTPHLFLTKKSDKGLIIEYTGAIDDDPEGTNIKRSYFMDDAVKALLTGEKPAITTSKAIGCTVKKAKTAI